MLRKAVVAFSLVLDFHSICSSFAADVPASGRGQTTAPLKRIGVLASVYCPGPGEVPAVASFVKRLAELGWIEGRTVVIDCVNAHARLDQFPVLAVELVARRPNVLFGSSTPAVRALMQATTTIPIVTTASDPVRSGLVTNLARPETNVTGVAPMSFEVLPKRIQVLKELLPHLSRLALIFPTRPRDPTDLQQTQREMATAAKGLGFSWETFYAVVAEDYDAIFARLATEGFDAAYVSPGPLAYANQGRIARVALHHRIPTVADATEFVREGVLLSYGLDSRYVLAQGAIYIDKILRGVKPADLPVEQPTKFELVINVKTAKTLGITIPQSLLLRADEVIQ